MELQRCVQGPSRPQVGYILHNIVIDWTCGLITAWRPRLAFDTRALGHGIIISLLPCPPYAALVRILKCQYLSVGSFAGARNASWPDESGIRPC